jgi:4-diphosphocytidyl-2-C-methyl-D-erythritol kinase
LAFQLEAFAKVNLSLGVLGKRRDGFHELDTLFQTVDLSDTLTFQEWDRFEFRCDDPAVPSGEENLVVQAAHVLAEAARKQIRGRVDLSKRIPAGGGMGGGSSDGASALLGLSALWGIRVDAGFLAPLAARLGSDVPFFLVGGTARGTGRGERITPLEDAGPKCLLLVFPSWPVPTAEVFGILGAPLLPESPELTDRVSARNLRGSGPESFPDRNDLEGAAERLRGELAVLRNALTEVGATQARLSGSGSTLFGVFPDLLAAAAAGREIVRRHPDVRTACVRSVERAEFSRRALPEAGRDVNR